MKRVQLKLLSVLLLSLIFSCSKNEENDLSFEMNRAETFELNTDYHSADNSLNFQVLHITDSRCPEGLYCLWQGNAVVQIAFEKPIFDTLSLDTHFNPVDTISNYEIELLEVNPYPVYNEEVKLEDYEVVMKITQL